MTNEKAIMCLEDMKIKVPIPKAAKQARENNEALDVAIKALTESEHSTNLASLGTDCISRQQAIDGKICIQRANGVEIYDDYAVPVEYLKRLPPIQPKRGKWIRTGSGSLYDHYECSECGKAPKWDCMGDNRWKIAFTDFCPNCGAKMEMEHYG